MTDCRKCVEFEWCAEHEDCGSFKPKPKTNADRIRSMTDEELAKWLWFKVGKCPPFDVCPSPCIPCEVKDCWLDWLRQEATE